MLSEGSRSRKAWAERWQERAEAPLGPVTLQTAGLGIEWTGSELSLDFGGGEKLVHRSFEAEAGFGQLVEQQSGRARVTLSRVLADAAKPPLASRMLAFIQPQPPPPREALHVELELGERRLSFRCDARPEETRGLPWTAEKSDPIGRDAMARLLEVLASAGLPLSQFAPTPERSRKVLTLMHKSPFHDYALLGVLALLGGFVVAVIGTLPQNTHDERAFNFAVAGSILGGSAAILLGAWMLSRSSYLGATSLSRWIVGFVHQPLRRVLDAKVIAATLSWQLRFYFLGKPQPLKLTVRRPHNVEAEHKLDALMHALPEALQEVSAGGSGKLDALLEVHGEDRSKAPILELAFAVCLSVALAATPFLVYAKRGEPQSFDVASFESHLRQLELSVESGERPSTRQALLAIRQQYPVEACDMEWLQTRSMLRVGGYEDAGRACQRMLSIEGCVAPGIEDLALACAAMETRANTGTKSNDPIWEAIDRACTGSFRPKVRR